MSPENILILVFLVIAAFIAVRFLTRILAKFIAFAIVVALIIYLLFYWKGGVLNIGQDQFILYELEQKYCVENGDSIKCHCIIQPLIADIESKYSPEEIEKLTESRQESLEALINSIRDNQESIKECLQENNSGSTWKDFQDDLRSSWFNKKLKELIGEKEKVFKESV